MKDLKLKVKQLENEKAEQHDQDEKFLVKLKQEAKKECDKNVKSHIDNMKDIFEQIGMPLSEEEEKEMNAF